MNNAEKLEELYEKIEAVREDICKQAEQQKKGKSEAEHHIADHLQEIDELLETASGAVSEALAKLREE